MLDADKTKVALGHTNQRWIQARSNGNTDKNDAIIAED